MTKKIEDLKKRKEQLAARIQREEAKASVAKRKAQTRAKIVLGGYMAALMAEDDKLKAGMLKKIEKMKSEKDKTLLKKAFFDQ
mgnify:CR=1 FL=1